MYVYIYIYITKLTAHNPNGNIRPKNVCIPEKKEKLSAIPFMLHTLNLTK